MIGPLYEASPQILKALRDMALIQSAESSNRIVGITVQAQRLKSAKGAKIDFKILLNRKYKK